MTIADMDWDTTLQIGQGKSCFPIAAIGRAQQRKEGLVLAGHQELAIAESPAFGGKVEGGNPNFSQEWIRHACFPSTKTAWLSGVALCRDHIACCRGMAKIDIAMLVRRRDD